MDDVLIKDNLDIAPDMHTHRNNTPRGENCTGGYLHDIQRFKFIDEDDDDDDDKEAVNSANNEDNRRKRKGSKRGARTSRQSERSDENEDKATADGDSTLTRTPSSNKLKRSPSRKMSAKRKKRDRKEEGRRNAVMEEEERIRQVFLEETRAHQRQGFVRGKSTDRQGSVRKKQVSVRGKARDRHNSAPGYGVDGENDDITSGNRGNKSNNNDNVSGNKKNNSDCQDNNCGSQDNYSGNHDNSSSRQRRTGLSALVVPGTVILLQSTPKTHSSGPALPVTPNNLQSKTQRPERSERPERPGEQTEARGNQDRTDNGLTICEDDLEDGELPAMDEDPLSKPVDLICEDDLEDGELPTMDDDPLSKPVDLSLVRVPVWLTLLIMTCYILGGAVMFTVWERDWDFLEGSYFCFITLSTIGFGDFVPGTSLDPRAAQEKWIMCCIYLLLGMAMQAMCFHLMQEEVRSTFRRLGARCGLMAEEDTATTDNNTHLAWRRRRRRRRNRSRREE